MLLTCLFSCNPNLVIQAIINGYFFIIKLIIRFFLNGFVVIEQQMQFFSLPLSPRLLPNETRN